MGKQVANGSGLCFFTRRGTSRPPRSLSAESGPAIQRRVFPGGSLPVFDQPFLQVALALHAFDHPAHSLHVALETLKQPVELLNGPRVLQACAIRRAGRWSARRSAELQGCDRAPHPRRRAPSRDRPDRPTFDHVTARYFGFAAAGFCAASGWGATSVPPTAVAAALKQLLNGLNVQPHGVISNPCAPTVALT